MEASQFRFLLETQKVVLSEFDTTLKVTETRITDLPPGSFVETSARDSREMLQRDPQLGSRLADACRLVADAYMACDARQREVLRHIVQGFPNVNACMGIQGADIRTKIDGPRFRLGLIYESVKDLCPDADDAVDHLDTLCRAAKDAGFDPNPYLAEIAEVSSHESRAGKSSMRDLLLARMANKHKARCEVCREYFDAQLPQCPYCAAFAKWPKGKSPFPEVSKDAPGPDQLGFGVEVHPPTLKLIGYFLLLLMPIIAVVLIIFLVVMATSSGPFFRGHRGWTHLGVIVALVCGVVSCRSSYVNLHRWNRNGYGVWMSCGQLLILLGVTVTAIFGVIAFLIWV